MKTEDRRLNPFPKNSQASVGDYAKVGLMSERLWVRIVGQQEQPHGPRTKATYYGVWMEKCPLNPGFLESGVWGGG